VRHPVGLPTIWFVRCPGARCRSLAAPVGDFTKHDLLKAERPPKQGAI